MSRRAFIPLLGGAAIWPFAARAQQPERTRRIGVFMPYAAEDPETKARLAAFCQELERLGWSNERDVHIDYRFAANRRERYEALAHELLALQPDVILAQTTLVVTSLQQQTRMTPIVFTGVSDPVAAGIVDSLARPGGNLTGWLLYEAGIVGKWLGMLKEIAPGLTRVALIGNPKTTPFDFFVHAARAVAPPLALDIMPVPIEDTDAAIERAIQSFATAANGGLFVVSDPTTTGRRGLFITLAARFRLPAVYTYRLFVADGGLMSYGIDQIDTYRQAASYVDRILRGAKPSDLPVQAPTKYETVVNLKTAKALGLDVPPSLLARADEVIG
jgi:putative tryptophan/tyrosine transport system substrate-binding protein